MTLDTDFWGGSEPPYGWEENTMKIEELEDTDVGRFVAYRPIGQPHTTEIGWIKSWNAGGVFVVFLGPRKHFDPKEGERTPMWCLPETLRFITMRADGGFDELT
jgi:hypothetical protein